MAKLLAAFKRILGAMACAHAGDSLSGRQQSCTGMARKIALSAFAAKALQPVVRQHIALYMGRELTVAMIRHAVQDCTRRNCGLTVLSLQSARSAQAALSPYADLLTLAAIDVRLVTLAGDPFTGLTRYLRRHPEVVVLACNENGYLGRSLGASSQRRKALPIPVVLARAGSAESAAAMRDEIAEARAA